MYVALTRAMGRLYLPCVCDGEGEPKSMRGPYDPVNRRVAALVRGGRPHARRWRRVSAATLAPDPMASSPASAGGPRPSCFARTARRAGVRGPSRAPRGGGRDVVHASPERARCAPLSPGSSPRRTRARRSRPPRSTSCRPPRCGPRARPASSCTSCSSACRSRRSRPLAARASRRMARARRKSTRSSTRRSPRTGSIRRSASTPSSSSGRPTRRRWPFPGGARLAGFAAANGPGARDGVRLPHPGRGAGRARRRPTPARLCRSRAATCAARSTSRSSTTASRTSPTGRATRSPRTRPRRSPATSPRTTWSRPSSTRWRSCASSAFARARTTRRDSADCSTASCAASARPVASGPRGPTWDEIVAWDESLRARREWGRRMSACSAWSRCGTARAAWRASRRADEGADPPIAGADPEDVEPAYFGWEIARCAPGARARRGSRPFGARGGVRRVDARGSTRLPLDGSRLAQRRSRSGARPAPCAIAQRLLDRARSAGAAAIRVNAVIGRPGERKPLIVDGEWLYAERMHALEERFCARIRERVARSGGALEGRALDARSAGRRAGDRLRSRPSSSAPFARRSRRRSRSSRGDPGRARRRRRWRSLRAIAWTGTPMAQLAVAAPTGKAAQRLADAIALGLAQSRDLADAALGTIAPAPQTLHRLLGWSPSRGRFARHENDPLPYRFVVVDEASMIDLAMMDRLLRALRPDARLVLLGDADQLPSIEAGAVFRDLCAGLGAVRLSVNLRVANDPSARRITDAARAVNAGLVDARFSEAVTVRRSVDEVTFEGVEHLAARWSDVGDALLDSVVARPHRGRLDDSPSAASARTACATGEFDDERPRRAPGALRAPRALAAALRHARARLLRRARTPSTIDCSRGCAARPVRPASGRRARELCPGAPVSVAAQRLRPRPLQRRPGHRRPRRRTATRRSGPSRWRSFREARGFDGRSPSTPSATWRPRSR